MTEDPDLENNLLVTGGVFMALMARADLDPQIVSAPGEEGEVPTNAISIKPPWMNSRYRVTVTREPEEDPSGPGP